MQNKTEAKTSHFASQQTKLKQKIVITSRATSCMSNRQSLQVTSVNGRGDGLRKGDGIGHTSSALSWQSPLMAYCKVFV